MFILPRNEISDLTWRTQPAAQIRWLRTHEWLFEVGSDGFPRVATAFFEKRLVTW